MSASEKSPNSKLNELSSNNLRCYHLGDFSVAGFCAVNRTMWSASSPLGRGDGFNLSGLTSQRSLPFRGLHASTKHHLTYLVLLYFWAGCFS
jgi:hypothetical protein